MSEINCFSGGWFLFLGAWIHWDPTPVQTEGPRTCSEKEFCLSNFLMSCWSCCDFRPKYVGFIYGWFWRYQQKIGRRKNLQVVSCFCFPSHGIQGFPFSNLDQSIDTTNHRCLLVILSIFHYTTDLIINITYINISLYHIIHYELKSINIINMDFIKPSQYSIDFP